MYVFYGAVIVAIVLVPLGFYVASTTGDHHWVNRFGAAIVAAEATLLVLDYFRRTRFAKIKTLESDSSIKEAVEHEIESAERVLVFMIAVVMFVGQMLHGFGDLIYSLIFCH